MTTSQEQQIQDKIQIMISNINQKLHETKQMSLVAGNEQITHKGITTTFNEMIDLKNMDIESFIGYLFLTNQNEEVFGDFDQELVNVLFCSDTVIFKNQMNRMVKTILG